MDMRRLEVFCKVVELKSFTKAAEVLSLAQPTVSEHMRSLEESLGGRLVERLGRQVIPTPLGKMFLPYALEILRLRDSARQAVELFQGRLSGHLLVGASTIPGTYLLPGFIGAFKAELKDIEITLKIGDTAEISEAVALGNLEAGLVGSAVSDRRLVQEELFQDELVLAVYVGHPWAVRDAIAPSEIFDHPFVLRERGSGTRMTMNRTLATHGVDPDRLTVVAEMGSTEAVRLGIRARIGASVLSRLAVAEDVERGSLVQVPIDGILFRRSFRLVLRKNREVSPLCKAFVERLRSAASAANEAAGHAPYTHAP
ncbi:MAG: selenium metabolism-associated LysR family transcriptional regulator [Thermodesulfobacteriota bacterium]